MAWSEDPNDPQYSYCQATYEALAEAVDAKGRKLIIHKILVPSPALYLSAEDCKGLTNNASTLDKREAGRRLAASYINFYQGKDFIILPAFGVKEDALALAEMQKLFPNKVIHQILSKEILLGGGNIHCVTMCDDKIFFRPFDIFSKKRTMFNYEHLVNEIGHNEIPFSFDVFAQNPCKFYVVSTNALTGEVAYIEKSEPHFLPDAVAASGALPLTTYPVMFGGIPYLDGGVVCPIGFNKASEEGYEKIVVLATREKGFRKTHIKKSQLSLVNHMVQATKTSPSSLAL